MRRILIFSLTYYPRYVSGAEIAIKEITDRISPLEIEFDMITLNGAGEPAFEKIRNISVHRIFGKVGYVQKLMYPFFAFFKALQLNGKNKYDATWSMMASYNSFAALFFKLTHPKTPFLLTLQEGDPIPQIKRRALPMWPLFKMIFRKADHIQTISKYLADWALDMKAKCPITVVPNAVDFAFFSTRKSDTELAVLKESLGKRPDDVFIITTGRLVVKNAVADTIDALQYLPANVKFISLGQGFQEKMLKEKAEKLGLKERVQFLGFIPHKDMPQYLHISDIFIRPSLSEGFGNSYVEAMAAGIPVIATPVGGIVDFLKDGETGLFCEVQNPKSIAQKVEKLIKDKESRDYIIKNAEQMVGEKYEWGKIAGEMKKVLTNSTKNATR
ncbi:MAG: glycosyltransferase family 4 protein [Patescibacteria group bacterium]